jgi:hypothetical protein
LLSQVIKREDSKSSLAGTLSLCNGVTGVRGRSDYSQAVNPSIALKLYSHWFREGGGHNASILDTKSANIRQMLEKNENAEKEEKTAS